MGLICSLRGHDWSETELEDDRDERGSEVVLTVREYEVCSRCDARNLVSENTEVTTTEDQTDEATTQTADDDSPGEADPDDNIFETDADDETPADPEADDDDDGAVIVDAEGESVDEDESTTEGVEATDDAEFVEESTATDAGGPTDPHADPATDDGIILPSEDEQTDERAHGEWPAHETDEPAPSDDDREWPGQEGDAVGTPDDDSGSVDPSEAAPAEFDTAAGTSEGYDAEFIDENAAPSPQSGRGPTGITSAGEVSSPTEGTPASADAELVCPACGNAESRARSSLRAGDICPECRRGYLSESTQ
ncbi:DUF7093 family protein [Haloarchaeobius sp. HRN-SO-5]|uniref:DUF7093 family protein n=1 Tax=Haloarchaeobius sp. HRN-SO-5 TaxID=3446118 RepID=UPI003EB91365